MKAKFDGKCGYCETRFHAGDEIEKTGGRWCVVNCAGCAKKHRQIDLMHALEARMLEKHNIMCGYDFEEKGHIETGTRYEFIRKAQELGEATQEEIDAWMGYWSSYSLQHSLAD